MSNWTRIENTVNFSNVNDYYKNVPIDNEIQILCKTF